MVRMFTLGLFMFLAVWLDAAEELTINYNPPTPIRVLGTIYTDALHAPSIESVKSWGPYLYLAARYVNGDQKLEIWDVRDPEHPVFKQALDYGNLMVNPTDHWRFPSVNVFDDALVVRSNFMETIYHHDPTGALITDGVNDFAATVAGMKNNEESLIMSSAGSYATYFGRLFDPYEVLPEEEYGYLVLNFANPRKPFVAALVPSASDLWYSDTFSGHLNSLFTDAPSVSSVVDNHVLLSGRKALTGNILDVFWEPRFDQIFHSRVLHSRLRDLIEQVVKEQSFPDLLSGAVDHFFDGLQIEPQRTIEDSLRITYPGEHKLLDVLAEYNIGLDESVRAAIQKIVSQQLTLELEKNLSASLFAPMLQGWMDDIFNVPIDTIDDFRNGISGVLNADLSEETVARYVLDRYIAPNVDVPDWMFWTMDEMVNEVCDSPAGEAISAVIGPAYVIASADGFVEEALDFVPDVKKFYLPAGFPEDCRDLLEYAFFENGAKLKHDGLAFMELFKFYQYYNRNSDYLNFEKEFFQKVKEAQEKLSAAVVETIEPFTAILSFAGDMQERIQSFSESLPCRDVLVQAISAGILHRLEITGISSDETVHDALKRFQLYVDLTDALGLTQDTLASVDDLVSVLNNNLNMGQIQVRTLWDEAKAFTDLIEDAGRKALTRTVQEAWGDLDLDMTVNSALREFLSCQIDYRWTFGETMDDLLKNFVSSALESYPAFVDFIDVWERAVKGDVIARWQATFEAARDVSALLDWTGSLPATYEMLELTLQETYRQATGAAVKMVLSEFAHILYTDILGGFARWGTATQDFDFSFDASELFSSLVPVRTSAFAWKNQLGILSREEWDLINPRRLGLLLFDPANPDTRLEAILDGWGQVDYVHEAEGIVMICGSQFIDRFPTSTAMFLALGEDVVNSYTLVDYRLAGAEGLLTVNHGTHLVAYGPGGLFIIQNPAFVEPGVYEPKTDVREWSIQ